MKEPGLDGRHRDKNGQISRKHGNTLVSTLRRIYGAKFAEGYDSHEKLENVLNKLKEPSLSQLRKDHDDDVLADKIRKAEA